MELRPSDDQELLRATARDFLSHAVPLGDLGALEDRAGLFDADLWSRLAELGWLGLAIPEASGGSGGSVVDLELLCEELGRALCPAPFLAVAVAATAVLESAAEPSAATLLAEVVAGRRRPVLAAAGPSGRLDDDPGVSWKDGALTGEKAFVQDANTADAFLVTAHDAEGVLVVVLVDPADGVEVEPQHAISGFPWSRVRFEGVRGVELGAAEPALDTAFARVATMQGAWCAGGATRLLEDTVAYASERVQFGVPIGSFQAVQHQLADCDIAAAEATTLARQAAQALEDHSPFARRLASVAFLRAGDSFVEVARRCHQIWGGMGFSTEAHVHLFSRRAKAAQHSWGGVDHHLGIVADELLRAPLVRDRYPWLVADADGAR